LPKISVGMVLSCWAWRNI